LGPQLEDLALGFDQFGGMVRCFIEFDGLNPFMQAMGRHAQPACHLGYRITAVNYLTNGFLLLKLPVRVLMLSLDSFDSFMLFSPSIIALRMNSLSISHFTMFAQNAQEALFQGEAAHGYKLHSDRPEFGWRHPVSQHLY
jgi:hypothetical protein